MSIRCRLCDSTDTRFLFKYPDKESALVDIYQCSRCACFFPNYDLETITSSMVAFQVDEHNHLWSGMTIDEAQQLAVDSEGIVRYYKDQLEPPGPGEYAIEIGAGRGGLVQAMRNLGYPVLACEASSQLVEQARKLYGLPQEILSSLEASSFLSLLRQSNIPVKMAFLWHVLEHMEEPMDVLRSIGDLLLDNGYVICQVPLICKEWIYKSHLFFLNELSVAYIAKNCHLDVYSTNYDAKLKYMAFVLKKGSKSR